MEFPLQSLSFLVGVRVGKAGHGQPFHAETILTSSPSPLTSSPFSPHLACAAPCGIFRRHVEGRCTDLCCVLYFSDLLSYLVFSILYIIPPISCFSACLS